MDREGELLAEIERLKTCNSALMKDAGKSTLLVELGSPDEAKAMMRIVVTDPTGDKVREMEVVLAIYKLAVALGQASSFTEAHTVPAEADDE